jgi:hypothetical protein
VWVASSLEKSEMAAERSIEGGRASRRAGRQWQMVRPAVE